MGGLHHMEVPLGPSQANTGRNPARTHSRPEEGIELCFSETYTNQLPQAAYKPSAFLLLGVWLRGLWACGLFLLALSHQWMLHFPPPCPSLTCSTWNKASGLMSNVYGGWKMAWLASSVAICASMTMLDAQEGSSPSGLLGKGGRF